MCVCVCVSVSTNASLVFDQNSEHIERIEHIENIVNIKNIGESDPVVIEKATVVVYLPFSRSQLLTYKILQRGIRFLLGQTRTGLSVISFSSQF